MSRPGSRSRATLLAVLAGAVIGCAVGSAYAPEAGAVTCKGPVNIIKHEGGNHRGVRSTDPTGMEVNPNTVDCAHVNSIFLADYASGVANMEAGWIVTQLGGCNNYHPSIDNHAHFF